MEILSSSAGDAKPTGEAYAGGVVRGLLGGNWDPSSRGSEAFGFRRKKYQIKRAMRARPATPPTTPPAIAPTGAPGEESSAGGVGELSADGVGELSAGSSSGSMQLVSIPQSINFYSPIFNGQRADGSPKRGPGSRASMSNRTNNPIHRNPEPNTQNPGLQRKKTHPSPPVSTAKPPLQPQRYTPGSRTRRCPASSRSPPGPSRSKSSRGCRRGPTCRLRSGVSRRFPRCSF